MAVGRRAGQHGIVARGCGAKGERLEVRADVSQAATAPNPSASSRGRPSRDPSNEVWINRAATKVAQA